MSLVVLLKYGVETKVIEVLIVMIWSSVFQKRR